MRIHHLNCGTMCPWGGRLMFGAGRDPADWRLVCHCLLIETDAQGLVLVDTGLGLRDVRMPRPRLSPFFMMLNRIQLHESETALRQIEGLGFQAADVRHILLTHLDFDHAGGLEDFPDAQVHVLRRELHAAHAGRRGFVARHRYRPQQWDEAVRWQAYEPSGEDWYGFEAVRALRGLPPDILMVPLAGHTWGHSGVAVRQGGRWLLLAGDAYFHEGELRPEPYCPPGLRAYQWLMQVDRRARLGNQRRLRELAGRHAGEVEIVSAHDAVEFARARDRAPWAAAAQ